MRRADWASSLPARAGIVTTPGAQTIAPERSWTTAPSSAPTGQTKRFIGGGVAEG